MEEEDSIDTNSSTFVEFKIEQDVTPTFFEKLVDREQAKLANVIFAFFYLFLAIVYAIVNFYYSSTFSDLVCDQSAMFRLTDLMVMNGIGSMALQGVRMCFVLL